MVGKEQRNNTRPRNRHMIKSMTIEIKKNSDIGKTFIEQIQKKFTRCHLNIKLGKLEKILRKDKKLKLRQN